MLGFFLSRSRWGKNSIVRALPGHPNGPRITSLSINPPLFLGALLAILAISPLSFAGNVTLDNPTSGSAWTLTLPTSAGTNLYVLATDGTGITSWVAPASGTGIALSSLTGASATNSFNNAAYAQTWAWNTLSSGTAMTLSSSSLTTGTLLSLQNSNASASATGKVLNLSNSTTGAGIGLESTMNGTGNNGYAGYFSVTATNGVSYALAGVSASVSGYGGYFANTSTGWALAATGTSYFNGFVGFNDTTPGSVANIYYVTGGTNPFVITSGGVNEFSVDSYGNVRANGPSSTYMGTDSNISNNDAFSNAGNTYFTSGENAAPYVANIEFFPASGGDVGINQLYPQATLDVGGYMRMTLESAAPVTCSSTYNGAVALTANFTLCVCKGSVPAWYLATNGTTACSW